jgi:hypothetical protein
LEEFFLGVSWTILSLLGKRVGAYLSSSFAFFWTAVTCHRFALQCEALFGITATYIGSRIIGSKSKNTKAAMNRRTPKSAKLELRSGSNAALYSLGTPVSTIFCALNP